jgi:hypothetical protein
MSKKFGVSLADKIAEDVERPLEYGDTRSERIEELVAAGLRAEELCLEYGFEYEDRHEFQSLITQAFLALDRQDRQQGEVDKAET